MKIKIRKKLILNILETIAIIGAFTVAATSPYFWRSILKSYFRHRQYYHQEILKLIRFLRYRGYIQILKKEGLIKVELTERGRKRLKNLKIWDLKIKKPKKWDKKWRIIIFDVPKEKNKTRDIFRLKLREFGFYQLQKSVWIYPHECLKEIVLLRKLLNIIPNVKIITSSELEADEKILKHFRLLKKAKN